MSHGPFRRRRRHCVKPGHPSAEHPRHVVEDRCGPTGKVRYRSEGAALVALEVIAENGDPRHQERRAYKCPLHCGGWHLTKRGAA